MVIKTESGKHPAAGLRWELETHRAEYAIKTHFAAVRIYDLATDMLIEEEVFSAKSPANVFLKDYLYNE